jgi:hypothetical protein
MTEPLTERPFYGIMFAWRESADIMSALDSRFLFGETSVLCVGARGCMIRAMLF